MWCGADDNNNIYHICAKGLYRSNFNLTCLTLKWPRYFSRWCPRGGGSMEPPWENHFSTGILQWNLHHICRGYKKSQFCKKILKCCSVSKWRPNNRFLFRVILILAKFWKNTFPKEFYNEIWLKERECE